MTAPGLLQLALYLVVLIACTRPLGRYMARIYAGDIPRVVRWMRPVERTFYRLSGTSESKEMDWRRYATAVQPVGPARARGSWTESRPTPAETIVAGATPTSGLCGGAGSGPYGMLPLVLVAGFLAGPKVRRTRTCFSQLATIARRACRDLRSLPVDLAIRYHASVSDVTCSGAWGRRPLGVRRGPTT